MKLLLLAFALAACGAEPSSEPPASEAPAPGRATCGAGELRDEAGRCGPVERVVVAPGGRAFWVVGSDPRADDEGPGTRERPWRTIGRAAGVGVLRPGDAVIVRAGVYRESVEPRAGGTGADRRVTYAAYPGETVVVTGADPADDGWTRDAATGAWRRAWGGEPLPAYADLDSDASDAGPRFRRELVVAGSLVLRPVYRAADLRPGTFYVEGPDTAPRAVLARFPTSAAPAEAGPIEIARRTYLFRPLGDAPEGECGSASQPGWLRVVGITFRHAANRAQWGAVCAGREGALVEDVTVEWTNGRGLDGSGRGHVFRRVRADHHGQLGLGAQCTGCVFEGGTLIGNNWKGHSPFWEAGGAKWSRTSDTVVRDYLAADNEGPGFWFDGANTRNTLERFRATNNAVAGVMLELNTTRTLVQHGAIERTRWLEWSGAGLLSQAASENAIAHVTFRGNTSTGLWLRLDPDRRAPDGGNVVFANHFAGNAVRSDVEGREVMLEGLSLDHARSTRFARNVYARHPEENAERSTYFVVPVPGEEAGYRGNGLAAWQALTRGDEGARLVTRAEAGATFQRATGGLAPEAVLRGFGASSAPYRESPSVGADPALLPPISD